MKKLRNFATIICTVCLFAIPTSGFAQLTLMTDAELDQITAQAGFSDMLGIIQVNQDEETGTYYFGGRGGYISFSDTSYQGSVGIDPAVTTQIVDNNGATGFEARLDGPVVDMTDFHTTVKLGQQINMGDSLGTLSIGRLIVNVHGTLRVTSK
jgi:hypothetical protein